MEEDDLLEPDRPRHQDLRHKLQRGGGREGAPREAVRREWRERDPPHPPPPLSRGSNSRAPIPSRPRNDPMGAGGGILHGEQTQGREEHLPPTESLKENLKPKEDKPKRAEGNKSSDICFRCNEVGHHQLNCTNDPICYKCKLPGHMAAECAGLHCQNIKMFGFGIPRQGFYSIEIPDVEQVDKFGGLISITEGKLERKL